MSLDYSRCPLADQNDAAKKARTELFFKLLERQPKDALGFLSKKDEDSELLALVQQGICLEARDDDGKTALIYAIIKPKYFIVQKLIAAGADIEATNKHGWTALMSAAKNGKDSTARELIAAGADIEARVDGGFTVLMISASYGKDSIVQALIGLGANVYARNNLNKRPIDEIRRSWDMGIEEGEAAYADFAENHTAPTDKAKIYQLLAFTPLLDDKAKVDYVGNLRKICINANWDSRDQAEALLEELQADGVINASDVGNILQQSFPPLHTNRLLTSTSSRRER